MPVLAMGLSMALSTLAHSIMVVSLLYLFSFNSQVYADYFPNTGIIAFLLAILGLNALLEIILAVLVGTPIGMRIKDYKEQV